MSAAYDGNYLWIWQGWDVLDGSVKTLIEQAQQLGITGVIIKFANGSLVGDANSQKYMQQYKSLAPAFKTAGFKVGAWIYQYLTDVSGEVDACVQAANIGADFIILDAEDDVKGKDNEVKTFGQLLRSKLPDMPIGLSSFAVPSYHSEVPWESFKGFIDFVCPQIYWAEMGWSVDKAFNQSVQEYKQLFDKPVAPTGQAYGSVNAADMKEFADLCKSAGFTHLSWWDWQECCTNTSIIGAIKTYQLPTVQTAPVPAKKSQTIPYDIAGDEWYAKAVAWAIKQGFMHPDKDTGNFDPNEPLTRAEIAQVLYNLFHQGN